MATPARSVVASAPTRTATRTPLAKRAPASKKPSLRIERTLLRAGHRLVAGMDEVGRGALAGPVTVGVVVVDETTKSGPVGLRDSKLLAPAARQKLLPKVRRWAPAWAIGHASSAEVDTYGIIAALRLAGTRALAQLRNLPDIIVLDGNHDWLTPPQPPQPPQPTLLDLAELSARPAPPLPCLAGPQPRVQTMIKADIRCTAVAAASVLAKTTRDALMVDLATSQPEFARFGWAENKGYSAPEHLAALTLHGPTEVHRRSWRLPGMMEYGESVAAEEEYELDER